jgi:aspartyl-tRNA synthetase
MSSHKPNQETDEKQEKHIENKEEQEINDEESESSEENDMEFMLKTGDDKEEDLLEGVNKDLNTLNILNENLRVKCNMLYKEMADEGILSNEVNDIDDFSPFDDEYINYVTEHKDLSKRQKEALDLLKKYKEKKKTDHGNGHDHGGN